MGWSIQPWSAATSSADESLADSSCAVHRRRQACEPVAVAIFAPLRAPRRIYACGCIAGVGQDGNQLVDGEIIFDSVAQRTVTW
ncbi:MAG: hypothetical protein CMF24_06040 [Ilumatobacter sp.]|nr:hypothetical protein [Ilumatobacter sp.]